MPQALVCILGPPPRGCVWKLTSAARRYCGTKSDLTVDHVIPTSQGGSWSWENLVTACNKCNCKKGSKSLEQLGWKLRKRPQARPSCRQGACEGVLPAAAP